jgi:hypothetical protein
VGSIYKATLEEEDEAEAEKETEKVRGGGHRITSSHHEGKSREQRQDQIRPTPTQTPKPLSSPPHPQTSECSWMRLFLTNLAGFFSWQRQDFGSESDFFFRILPGKKILPVRSQDCQEYEIPAEKNSCRDFLVIHPGRNFLPGCREKRSCQIAKERLEGEVGT